MDSALVVIQAADILRTYTVLVTAIAMGMLTVAFAVSGPMRKRVIAFIVGVDTIMVALIFGQLANVGRSISWRTCALAVGVTLVVVTSWVEVRERRAALKQSTERTEDGDQSA